MSVCEMSQQVCVYQVCITEMTPSVSVDAWLIGFQDAEVEHRGRGSRQRMQRGDQWISSWWQGNATVAIVTEYTESTWVK